MLTSRLSAYDISTWLCLWLILGLSGVSVAAAAAPDHRVRPLAERWLELLNARTLEVEAYAPLLADGGWDLRLIEGEVKDLDDLRALLGARFRGLSSSHYQIRYFKTKPLDDGRHRLWLELDWQGSELDGLTAEARLDVELILEEGADGRLRIRSLHERYLAPLQGMGSRTQC